MLLEQLGEMHQAMITGKVPVLVINFLEKVEIAKNNRKTTPVALRLTTQLRENFLQMPTIVENVVNPPTPLDPIHLKIDQSGALYWNDTPVDQLGLKAQFAVIAQQATQPEIQIAANDAVAYEAVARVLSDAKSYNLTKIGFTDNN